MDWNTIFDNKSKTDYQEVAKILHDAGFRKTFKIFHVVGTNGKGSVANFLEQGFRSQGKSVGLFTSPHLIKPNERIKTNNHNITDEEFTLIHNKIKELKLNFFATMYVVAMLHFMYKGVEVAIVEAGIGGNMDTTKAVQGEWACLTNVSLDHTEILGKTMEQITTDKVGIAEESKMKFYYPSNLPRKLEEIVRTKVPQAKKINNEGATYKIRNTLFAKNILEDLGIAFDRFIFPEGRTQVIKHNGKTAIFDVAHNYDGIKKSLEQLEHDNVNYRQVVLMLNKSKDNEGIMELFEGKYVYVYQQDEEFYSSEELKGSWLADPVELYHKMDKDTLFIGSFRLIGKVLEASKHIDVITKTKKITSMISSKTNVKDRLQTFLREQFRFSISEISLAAILIALWVVSAMPVFNFNLGFMHIGITYVWPILIALISKPLFSIVCAVIGDNLSLLSSGTGFAQWMPEYAIIPIAIVIVVSLFKSLIKAKNNYVWWFFVALSLLASIGGVFITMVAEKHFVHAGRNTETIFDFTTTASKAIIWTIFSLIVLVQLSLIVVYILASKHRLYIDEKRVKTYISFYSLVTLITVLAVWAWGPFAQIRYLVVYSGSHKNMATYLKDYDFYLIPRILKTPIILAIYPLIIIPIYEAYMLMEKRISRQNKW